MKPAVVDLLDAMGSSATRPDSIYGNVYEACADHITQEQRQAGSTADGGGVHDLAEYDNRRHAE